MILREEVELRKLSALMDDGTRMERLKVQRLTHLHNFRALPAFASVHMNIN